MPYQYDLSDFKRYLHERNEKYRVDGLIFWQNRIPLPIDLFNRIFDDADSIVFDYVRQVSASALVYSNATEFASTFGLTADELPTSSLKNQQMALVDWVEHELDTQPQIKLLAMDIAELLGLDGLELTPHDLVAALSHQGKKYARLFMTTEIKTLFDQKVGATRVGTDNTDMFGNVVADRYNVYRSGFSDALAIIFNALLDFRILCAGKGVHLKRLNLSVEKADGIDVRLGRTADGSLWEPQYDDDHVVVLSKEHPLLRDRSQAEIGVLAELLYCLAEFENNQYSDNQKKLLENMRQEISRSLWIRHD